MRNNCAGRHRKIVEAMVVGALVDDKDGAPTRRKCGNAYGTQAWASLIFPFVPCLHVETKAVTIGL